MGDFTTFRDADGELVMSVNLGRCGFVHGHCSHVVRLTDGGVETEEVWQRREITDLLDWYNIPTPPHLVNKEEEYERNRSNSAPSSSRGLLIITDHFCSSRKKPTRWEKHWSRSREMKAITRPLVIEMADHTGSYDSLGSR